MALTANSFMIDKGGEWARLTSESYYKVRRFAVQGRA
jgi:hypothetical protein